MSEVTIEDVQSYIRNKERHPIMTVRSIDDPDYKTMRNFVLDIKNFFRLQMKILVQ